MNTIVAEICSDVASLLAMYPFNLFLGFAIFGLVCGILIKWFKFRA